MTSQFDLTPFYDVIIRNSVFQLGFLAREFQISVLNVLLVFRNHLSGELLKICIKLQKVIILVSRPAIKLEK